jgi:hypothetical protein
MRIPNSFSRLLTEYAAIPKMLVIESIAPIAPIAPMTPRAMAAVREANRTGGALFVSCGADCFCGRHFAGSNWRTLTVPKTKSGEFNAQVASGEKSQR